jgi:hypothetical protein
MYMSFYKIKHIWFHLVSNCLEKHQDHGSTPAALVPGFVEGSLKSSICHRLQAIRAFITLL